MSPEPMQNYFALETGDFLDRMERVLSAEGPPDLDRLLRLAKSIRGSARIAGAEQVERAAAVFEKAVRALRDGHAEWEETLRERAVRTVDDLRILVRGHPGGGAGSAERSAGVVARWEDLAAVRPERTSPPPEGIVPFVRAELLTTAAMLRSAVDALRRDGGSRDALRKALQRTRAVRGVKGGDVVADVQGILAELEGLIETCLAAPAAVPEVSLTALEAGVEMLERVEEAVAAGSPLGDVEALEAFRSLRSPSGSDRDDGVRSISEFFPDDDRPVLLASRRIPVPAGVGHLPEEALELVRLRAAGILDQGSKAVSERSEAAIAGLGTAAGAVGELAAAYRIDPLARAARRLAARTEHGAESVDALGDDLRAIARAVPGGLEAPDAETSPAAPASGGGDPVPVESLLYRGRPALEAALALRDDIDRLVDDESRRPELREAVRELFDLVELGMQPADR